MPTNNIELKKCRIFYTYKNYMDLQLRNRKPQEIFKAKRS